MVQTLLVYAGLLVAPSAAFALARRAAERWSRGSRRQRPAPPVPPVEHRLEVLTARLARLDADLDRLGSGRAAGGGTRLRALALTYDDTLRECCAALGGPDPGPAPLAGATRLQVEADLARRGLRW